MATVRDQKKPPVQVRRANEAALLDMSSRLAGGEHIDDAVIRELLAPGVVPAFRHAQQAMAGLARKTTGEPAFCHSADIAIRARLLGYDSGGTLSVCLLHDVVEEQSETLADVSVNLARLTETFGESVARDIRLMTNRYSVVIREVCRGVPLRRPFGEAFLNGFAKALAAYRRRLSADLQREFGAELDLLAGFLPVVDVGAGLGRGRFDRKVSGDWELRLQTYRLFVQELCDDTALRFQIYDDGRGEAEAPLICKSLDLIDNLRTSPVVIRRSLERTLVKAELFLDTSFYLHDVLYERNLPATFVTVYDLLKYHLVQQLSQRRLALQSLSDTRFAVLAKHLMREVGRLEAKYRVNRAINPQIEALTERIRVMNAA